ncbi:hypothetical protein Lade_0531 [Legionella adelaidensis]|uniref:Uncharacterized protein n=1 Tax=Legionella adelaidensis TaxID=45056 RepID=A0A0W0R469_9GAMM|nr:nucleic acid/nucleotide deaminase domain-containing protein [Legionella adelaidensis]KTC65873.1 hypothetical protein Lade_0531 [Legionella adelaidensis]
MRIEKLQALLIAECEQKSVSPDVLPSVKILKSILYCGAHDEDITRFVVPKIIEMASTGKFSKDAIMHFIHSTPQIRILEIPVRHALDDTIEQRRMDSLSRLISLDNKYTPCTAVAFYKGELILSSNSPADISDDQLADWLAAKIGIIQEFLHPLLDDLKPGSQPNLKTIQFSTRARLLATESVLKLMNPEIGGIGQVVPAQHRKIERKTPTAHLVNALLKLGKHCVLGVLTNGKKGFTEDELKALLAPNSTIVVQNRQVLTREQLHAEQAILYYLRHHTDFKASGTPINIGISKLCCRDCHNVLNREKQTSHRGSHGVKFPNVYDIDTQQLASSERTRLDADLCASDSDSDCDFLPQLEDDFDIPKLESFEAAAAAAPKPSIKSQEKHMFFKTCNEEPQQAIFSSAVAVHS